jgi:hypothetical protein
VPEKGIRNNGKEEEEEEEEYFHYTKVHFSVFYTTFC